MKQIGRDIVIKNIVFFCVLAIIIGVEFAYRKPLFDISIRLQEELQDHITQAGINAFEAFSLWGNGPAYFVIFAIIFLSEARSRAFYYALFLTLTMFIMNLTKMAYHEPRPFMYSEKIKVYGCSAEYGNPSGHSIFAAAFNLFFYLDIFQSSSGPRKALWKLGSVAAFIFAIALAFVVGFSRFYVGVHTINQIVYGWLWGIWIALYFHYCLRSHVISHIDSLTQKQSIQTQQILKPLLLSSLGALLVFMSQIATYLIVDSAFDHEPLWLQMIATKCNKDVNVDKQLLNYKSVIQSGIPIFAYGAYIGILFQRKIFCDQLLSLRVYNNNFLKFLLRLIVLAVLVGPLGLLLLLIPWTLHLSILILVKNFLPAILGGFLMFAIVDYFWIKFRLAYIDQTQNQISSSPPRKNSIQEQLQSQEIEIPCVKKV